MHVVLRDENPEVGIDAVIIKLRLKRRMSQDMSVSEPIEEDVR